MMGSLVKEDLSVCFDSIDDPRIERSKKYPNNAIKIKLNGLAVRSSKILPWLPNQVKLALIPRVINVTIKIGIKSAPPRNNYCVWT